MLVSGSVSSMIIFQHPGCLNSAGFGPVVPEVTSWMDLLIWWKRRKVPKAQAEQGEVEIFLVGNGQSTKNYHL